ncbi:MAG: hypothetical protein JW812_02745 [Alphaproteobacteria bacterium]|nr:hypothetical protein [Alphaproteobacteria bacterium]MBN2780041.1 hypothetical protein [Alphaproteobacteria bacterium]
MLDLTPFKTELYDLMKKAGKAILEIYDKDFDVKIKKDKSPVTEADKKADLILHAGLKKLFPNIPIISEENTASHRLQNKETFF